MISKKKMSLKKYSTTSSILGTHLNPVSPSPSISTSTSPSPPELIKLQYHNNTNHSIVNTMLANQMSSLVDSIEQQQAAVSVSVIESSGSASDTIMKSTTVNNNTQLPNQIKSRLYALFCQIEHEFDLLYAENMRLKTNLNTVSSFTHIN